eukprot:Hpha_TRINITY_DN15115_c0_g1::TRINITY_DN15115_c0_g1_i1::g.129221::m.129221
MGDGPSGQHPFAAAQLVQPTVSPVMMLPGTGVMPLAPAGVPAGMPLGMVGPAPGLVGVPFVPQMNMPMPMMQMVQVVHPMAGGQPIAVCQSMAGMAVPRMYVPPQPTLDAPEQNAPSAGADNTEEKREPAVQKREPARPPPLYSENEVSPPPKLADHDHEITGDEGQAHGAPAEAASAAAGADESQKRTAILELPMGRLRAAQTHLDLSSGKHVVVAVVRGQEMGVVRDVTLEKPNRRLQQTKIVRVATPEEVETRDTRHVQDAVRALKFVRSLAAEHQVPLTIHWVHIQFDRRRMEFHYSSEQTHPDFRSLLETLHSRFRCRIWLNNCKPKHGQPGERIDPKFLRMG